MAAFLSKRLDGRVSDGRGEFRRRPPGMKGGIQGQPVSADEEPSTMTRRTGCESSTWRSTISVTWDTTAAIEP
jgi:hypothetical protein